MLSPIEINEWIQSNDLKTFRLAGVASDGEVFIEAAEGPILDDDGSIRLFYSLFKEQFPESGKITFVVKPSLAQLQDMVDDLNGLLKEDEPPKKPLLGIGGF